MQASVLIALDLSRLEEWVITVMGVAVVGLAFLLGCLLGCLLVGRRETRTTPKQKKSDRQRDPFLFGSATEKRASVRRGGNPVEVVLANPVFSEELGKAWVVDRSMGGLCLMSNAALRPGTILNVRPHNAPKGTPWTRIEVRSCRQESDHWEVGCKFERMPSWGVLLLFG